MAITETEYRSLLARVISLERHVNNLTVALDQCVSLSQVNELRVVYETRAASLEDRMTALENRLNNLEDIDVS